MREQSIVSLASVVIALCALIFSIVSFNRQQARAEQQQTRSEKLSVDSVKPLLWLQCQSYTDIKSIQIRNYGLGPAVIKEARFTRGQNSTDNIVDLFNHLSFTETSPPQRIRWETFINLPPRRAIPPQGDISLIKQSLNNLRSQGLEEGTALERLRRIQRERRGINAHIEYLDIFGNEMEPLDLTLID